MYLHNCQRPVIILGHGVRLSGADITPLLGLGVPILTSWPAADLIDSDHEAYFGRPGVYGQRCANKVLADADFVLAIGCRLSIWTVGYDFPRFGQELVMVDADEREAQKYGAKWVNAPINEFIQTLERPDCGRWFATCHAWRLCHPWLESPAHDHTNYVNPHRFMAQMQTFLKPDACIVADCATGSLAAHQILKLKPPQRLMTSGGLGEMGCGLPYAVGASFARDKGEVVCLTSDGGIMLTLSELATIAHHKLPIKIFVFDNSGYGMIRDTQRNLGYSHIGVGPESLSFPNFYKLAESFGITAGRHGAMAFSTADDNERWLNDGLRWVFAEKGPVLMHIYIDSDYVWAPKLRPGRNADGTIKHANFAEMEPAR
jgi:acetolactate synthase-1/2/3 large subunit